MSSFSNSLSRKSSAGSKRQREDDEDTVVDEVRVTVRSCSNEKKTRGDSKDAGMNKRIINTLYVGGIEYENEEAELFCAFLFSAMLALNLIKSKASCASELVEEVRPQRITRKGYLVLGDRRDATAALRLNKIPFLNRFVCLERPHYWHGPDKLKYAKYDWEDNLSQGLTPDRTCHGSTSSCETTVVVRFDPPNKSRFCPKLLARYMSGALRQLGLLNQDSTADCCKFQKYDGPGTMEFLDFSHPCDARSALRLQNLPYFDNTRLRFERKRGFNGDRSLDVVRSWEDSLREVYYRNHQKPREEVNISNELKRRKNENTREEEVCVGSRMGELLRENDELESRMKENEAIRKELERERRRKEFQQKSSEKQQEYDATREATMKSNNKLEAINKEATVNNVDDMVESLVAECFGKNDEFQERMKELATRKADTEREITKLKNEFFAFSTEMKEDNKELDAGVVSNEVVAWLKNKLEGMIEAIRKQIKAIKEEFETKEVAHRETTTKLKNELEKCKRSLCEKQSSVESANNELEMLRRRQQEQPRPRFGSCSFSSEENSEPRRRLETQEEELRAKTERVRELERKHMEHAEKILSLSNHLMSETTSNRRLERELRSERRRRRELEERLGVVRNTTNSNIILGSPPPPSPNEGVRARVKYEDETRY